MRRGGMLRFIKRQFISNTMSNAINWFEIPTSDMDRAISFYSAILNTELNTSQMGEYKMAFFPAEGVGGALVQGEGFTPSTNGVVPYLNGGNDLQEILSRVEAAGGTVILPKTQITEEIGYMAYFTDSEGNKIGLHSRS